MTQTLSSEEKIRLKKQWTDQAIKQAQEGSWDEAVQTNKNVLNIFPTEPDAYNRLGKAYSELGQYQNAHDAYSQTLKYSPANTIARKNIDRLALLIEQEGPVSARGRERIDPRLFVEEKGKTAVTELVNIATSAILAKVGVGDVAQLHINGHTLQVRNSEEEIIGQVEPRLANRIIEFTQGGNRYVAGIQAVENGRVRIITREVYQHPNMFGKVSFPSQGGGDTIRAYIKDSMLRLDRDDDEDFSNEDEYYDSGDESEEAEDVEFDGNLDSEE
ncbi:hypothetical protein KSD_10560 [Ktedonobacter sp. SOSP1-85]|uniref:tetratricopeptide repeat protein n=1 Tax=Ktedonobacter sp. SOSP1-85 TaxID=2778367 RepID=UPI00191656F2|nr:tetratricopeptide repeat protein [Ktedonobacter sp. SOSP1-85]GHO73285.1 hypothetical protein KSD_10560 [Ktedonobacter sp. SOSP1-85]